MQGCPLDNILHCLSSNLLCDRSQTEITKGEHALVDRPHTSLWLAKTYVIPAVMYGSQVWGTDFLQAGREFSSPLSTLHLHFLKGTLGVKQSTNNWAVLRECGHEPLQFYWFRSAV